MMKNRIWICSFCRENDKTDINQLSKTKVLLRYVEDIVRTVRGDTKELLGAVKNLHPNRQFSLETTDNKNSLPFLTCQLTYNTGDNFLHMISKTIRYWNNYRWCAPLQYKKSIIQGTIHRLFRAIFNWEAFHEPLMKMKKFENVINILGIRSGILWRIKLTSCERMNKEKDKMRV